MSLGIGVVTRDIRDDGEWILAWIGDPALDSFELQILGDKHLGEPHLGEKHLGTMFGDEYRMLLDKVSLFILI